MSISDEGSERILNIVFRGGKKLTSATLHLTLGKLIETTRKEIRYHAETGKQSLKRMSRSNSALQGVDVSNEAVSEFRRYAKKYKLDFSIVKHKNDPETYSLFFRQSDISKMESAVNDYMKDASIAHDGLDEKLQRAKAEALSVNKSRQKAQEKSKKKEVHLDKGER